MVICDRGTVAHMSTNTASSKTRVLSLVLAAFLAFGMAACAEDTGAEDTIEDTGGAAEDAGDAMEDTGDEMMEEGGDAMEEGGDAMEAPTE